MNLQIEKQKEKYDQIILKYEEDLTFRQETGMRIEEVAKENALRIEDIQKLNKKIDDSEMGLFTRIKNTDQKF